MSLIKLAFDEQVFSLEAVQKAAYRKMNLFIVDVSLNSGQIDCLLTPLQEFSQAGLSHQINEFKKEVLDQHLRIKIKSETEAVRNLILGITFSKTGFQAVE